MKNANSTTSRSTRLAWAFTLLVGGALAAGPVMADKPGSKGGGKNDHDGRQNEQRNDQRSDHRNDGADRNGRDEHHFDDRHRTLVREYYVVESRGGRCPPGLAKKNNGCMPPGQAKKWDIGRPLPRDVVYYAVPPRLVVQIGQPPSGYRYVSVAGDILMLAIGTGMVVDAIHGLGG